MGSLIIFFAAHDFAAAKHFMAVIGVSDLFALLKP